VDNLYIKEVDFLYICKGWKKIKKLNKLVA